MEMIPEDYANEEEKKQQWEEDDEVGTSSEEEDGEEEIEDGYGSSDMVKKGRDDNGEIKEA